MALERYNVGVTVFITCIPAIKSVFRACGLDVTVEVHWTHHRYWSYSSLVPCHDDTVVRSTISPSIEWDIQQHRSVSTCRRSDERTLWRTAIVIIVYEKSPSTAESLPRYNTSCRGTSHGSDTTIRLAITTTSWFTRTTTTSDTVRYQCQLGDLDEFRDGRWS